MPTIDPEKPCRDMQLLHPKIAGRFRRLADYLTAAHVRGETETLFLPYETYRYPQRQALLLRTTKNTKAGPFESAHQFGCAVDFVPYTDTWSWSGTHDYIFLRNAAMRHGLNVPIEWDLCHVEAPAWKILSQELRLLEEPKR